MSDEKSLNAKGSRHGGAILVDALVAQGVSRVFCVPGESYLARPLMRFTMRTSTP